MRIAIAALVLAAMAWLGAAPAKAAPVPLTGTASHTLAANADSAVTAVAKRSRKTVRRKCGWKCKRYYRPYRYRYWKFYYPFGGPLF